MLAAADEASALLKALANRHRLLIVCQLSEKERSVGELAALLNLRVFTVRNTSPCYAGTASSPRGATDKRSGIRSAVRRHANSCARSIRSIAARRRSARQARAVSQRVPNGARALRQINDSSRDLRDVRVGRLNLLREVPMRNGLVIAAIVAILAQPARAAETFTVELKAVADEKAVFATVESTNVVPAPAAWRHASGACRQTR